MRLLKKELMLALHPTGVIFPLLSAMLLIPNYPYGVVFFYTGLAVFFTCLNGRECNDIFYGMTLPIARKDIVLARFMLTMLMEVVQLIVAVPFALLRQNFPMPGNLVGMDANIALFGFAFVQYGIFNLLFFRVYYRNVNNVGKAFLAASTGSFVYIALMETAAHAVPFVRDRLDTSDPANLPEKLAVLAIGLILYLLMTYLAYKRAVKDFAKQDL